MKLTINLVVSWEERHAEAAENKESGKRERVEVGLLQSKKKKKKKYKQIVIVEMKIIWGQSFFSLVCYLILITKTSPLNSPKKRIKKEYKCLVIIKQNSCNWNAPSSTEWIISTVCFNRVFSGKTNCYLLRILFAFT